MSTEEEGSEEVGGVVADIFFFLQCLTMNKKVWGNGCGFERKGVLANTESNWFISQLLNWGGGKRYHVLVEKAERKNNGISNPEFL
jgi:hypothetical protein